MMKKLIILFLIGGIISSCSDYLDVNDDPNVPTEVTTELVLPAAEASIAVQVGGMLFNTGGFYAQYWSQAPEANQYNDLDKFNLKTDFLDNVYTELYAGALNDLEYIRTTAMAQDDPGNYLAATVLRAYTLQLLVDLIDRTPYSEALQGTDVLSPMFEDGKTIYDGIVTEIDDALTGIESGASVAATDMLLGGSVDEWIGFANAMKLKIFMRQSETSSNHSSDIQALLTANNFMTMDVKFASFSDEQNKRNSWYDTEVDRLGGVNHVATRNIISYMSSKADPRISKIWKLATATDSYEGNFPAGKTIPGIKNEDFSFPLMTATTPIYLYTQAELQLFIAEAELRYNSDVAAAEAAYQKAIDASLALHGIATPGSDLYGDGKPYEFDGTRKQIAMQKWVCLAMVNHIESWFETKRTEFPSVCSSNAADIIADPSLYTAGDRIYLYENTLGTNAWLTRFFYPDVAITRNQNVPTQAKLTDKVWWDQN
ncbi:SusD/RagB family nutrient-binding outer membrane lipoprotein [Saccharicrinis sp. GN24d3]|uniref:SusD/RagB family nutrient-binding outer membrane lipoprotein n=1 Tax=Saccharicrinis sp. GN24d3 TaxID=3458416 RepID=UPI004035934F